MIGMTLAKHDQAHTHAKTWTQPKGARQSLAKWKGWSGHRRADAYDGPPRVNSTTRWQRPSPAIHRCESHATFARELREKLRVNSGQI
jgi:hypothetical protein